MIFGRHINRYYLRYSPVLLLGLAALVLVDYFQLKIPELYRLVINGANGTTAFNMDVLLNDICLPMIFIGACAFSAPPSRWRPISGTACLTAARI